MLLKERERLSETLLGKQAKEAFKFFVEENEKISWVNLVIYQSLPLDPQEIQQKPIWETGDLLPVYLKRKEILAGEMLENLITKLPADKAVGMKSTVSLGKKQMRAYIPMIAFQGPQTADFLCQIKADLKTIGQQKGVILRVEGFFHYFGFELLRTRRSWEKFLGNCCLLDSVDRHYLGHQLVTGMGILRISPFKDKPDEPRVVELL